MGHDADVYNLYFNNRFYVRIKEETLNEKDHEVSMSSGELEASQIKQNYPLSYKASQTKAITRNMGTI